MTRYLPVRVDGFLATSLVIGTAHTCGLIAAGGVSCYGSNGFGQLGDGTTTNRSTPGQVSGLTNAAKLASGATTLCALRQTGVLSCWGDNSFGQLGDGSTTNRLVPTDVLWP